MLIPGRNSEGYRFGFNGQEKVDEIKGFGNHNTAEFGELDTRIGRRWNLDPKPNQSYSQYSVFFNSPIEQCDLKLDTPSVATRVEGAIQAVFGFGLTFAAAGATVLSDGALSPWTIATGVYAADQASAGLTKVVTGEQQQSFYEQGVSAAIQATGIDKPNADQYASNVSTLTSIALSGNVFAKVDATANFRKMAPIGSSTIVGKPTLRVAYETEVKGLSSIANKMRARGSSPEEIARVLHGLRREIGVKYKSLTPDNLLQGIYKRNIVRYGDKLGPSIEYLRQQGKSWEEIIRSASKPGGSDIGF